MEVPVDSYYAKHGEPGFVSVVRAIDFSSEEEEEEPVWPTFRPGCLMTSRRIRLRS